MAPPKPLDRRIEGLDVLRGIAASAVVLFHFTVILERFYPDAKPPPLTFEHGHYGVHLFFIISGFVILMSLERRGGEGFIRSRFFRLYPLYWVSVLLTYCVLSLTNEIPFSVTPFELAVNLTMLQDFVYVEPVDGVYWSLTYELGFYVFMYGLFRTGLSRFIAFVPVVMALFSLLFVVAIDYIPHPLHYLLVFHSYGCLFASGIALYLMKTRGVKLGWVAVVVAAPFVQFVYDGFIGFVAVSLCTVLAVWGVFFGTHIHRLGKPLMFLGTISYGLYLTHQMIGFTIITVLERLGLNALPAIGIAIAITVAIATGLTKIVDTYFTPALKNLEQTLKLAK